MARLKLPGPPVFTKVPCGVLASVFVAGGLAGCGTQHVTVAAASVAASSPYSVHGGQQPVGHATVQLYAVGTNGDGSASTPLFANPVSTNSKGQFALAPYTCPTPETPIYLVASGGDPGLGTTNQAIAMMDAIGPCSSLATATSLSVNEITTVAGVWALAPYMHSSTEVGSSTTDAAGLTAAFTLATKLANPQIGVTPGAGVPAGYTVPSSTINTAADILSACINSAGGTAGTPDPCGLLFAYAEASSGSAPNNTIDAALTVAKHPTSEVLDIFGLLPANAPFQPQLAAAPADWTISLVASVPAPTFAAVAVNGITTVTIADGASNSTIFYTADGTVPTEGSTPYSGALTLNRTTTLKAVATVDGASSLVASQTFTVAPQPARLVFTVQPTSAIAGAVLSPAVTVTVEDSTGNVVPAAGGTVSLALGQSSSGATLGGTLTAAPLNGVATFPGLSIPAAGSYTLVTSSSSLPSVTSAPITVTAAATQLPLVSAKAAAGFVDSVGIDVHFNYYGSIYTNNTPLMIQSLQALHITHLRDAMSWQGPESWNTFYVLHQQLGALGFKTDYVPAIDEPLSQISVYPSLVPDMEAVEPANEYDISGDSNWTGTIKAQAAAIYAAMKAAYPGVTVLAPSLAFPSNAATLGDISSNADAGNLHGYFGGFNPGSSTINPSIYLGQVKPETPNEPIWVTESGYFAQPGPFNGAYGVSPAAQAIYSPRSLLEWSNAGVARTYLYELADDEVPGEDAAQYHWGLLNADGSAKPAFYAVANLLTMLSDPGTTPGFKTAALGLQLEQADANVHQALFEKSDGSYYLALWVESSSCDFIHQTAVAVPTQNVTVDVGSAVAAATVTQWDAAGNVTTTALSPSQKLSATVSDKLQILTITLQ